MIIRVKKRDISIATLLLIFLSLIPLIYSQVDTSQGFQAWLTISNTPPNVSINNASFIVTPSAGGSVFVHISFNVTDAQGVSDINAESAVVNLTLGLKETGQHRANVSDVGGEFGTCGNHTESGVVIINCTIEMRFYDNASNTWVVNISVQDLAGAVSVNDTLTFTVSTISSFTLATRGIDEGANLNFTTLTPGDNDVAARAPLILNNTGNDNFVTLNITAAALESTTVSDTIPTTAFYINSTNGTTSTTDTNFGIPLLSTAIEIPGNPADDIGLVTVNASLVNGPASIGEIPPYNDPTTAAKGNQTILFWVDVPGGLAVATYNNTWNITAVTS